MSAGTITPKNWGEFQHYKDRKPSWIKLHRDLLDNYDFHCLPVASKALAPCLWLLASEYEGGAIPADYTLIAFRLRMSASEVEKAILPLIDKGFFVASKSLSEEERLAIIEKEKEKEREREKMAAAARLSISLFSKFWAEFPRKTAKDKAEQAWAKINPDQPLFDEIMAGLLVARASAQWTKDGGQFIPHPATWLNGKRWTDQPDAGPAAATAGRQRRMLDGAEVSP